MAFTTWLALEEKLLTAIADSIDSHQLSVKSVTQPDGITVNYLTLDDLLKHWRKIHAFAAAETSGENLHRPIVLRNANLNKA